MDLESVRESEVSQKEKNRYHVLIRMCGLLKNDGDEHMGKAEANLPMHPPQLYDPHPTQQAAKCPSPPSAISPAD